MGMDYSKTPVYKKCYEDAKRDDELFDWHYNQAINIACRNRIDLAIQAGYDGVHLLPRSFELAVNECGFDRVNFVLANSVRLRANETFSPSNKAWAESILEHSTESDSEKIAEYISKSDCAELDGFINQIRHAYATVRLYDRSHCIHNSEELNYEGQVLVMSPSTLNPEFRTSENQLFFATGGFGCKAGSLGKIIGYFLNDGERGIFHRGDFLGIVNQQYQPAWAKENCSNEEIQNVTLNL